MFYFIFLPSFDQHGFVLQLLHNALKFTNRGCVFEQRENLDAKQSSRQLRQLLQTYAISLRETEARHKLESLTLMQLHNRFGKKLTTNMDDAIQPAFQGLPFDVLVK
jgi:hypothetical protein